MLQPTLIVLQEESAQKLPARSLRFEDRPDYAYLRRFLKDLFFRENYQSFRSKALACNLHKALSASFLTSL